MTKFRRYTALLIAVLFLFVVAGCSGTVLAEVNNEKITKTDFAKRMKKEKLAYEQQGAIDFSSEQGKQMLKAIEEDTLQKMIEQVLITQTAKKEGVYPTKNEIAEKLKEVKANFPSEDEFNKVMKEYGYTIEELENKIGFEAAYEKLFNKVTDDVKIDDEAVKQWFDKNKEKYKNPAKIGARTILIKTDGRTEEEALKLAKDIVDELVKGADFAELAKKKSEDEYFKDEGGLVRDMAGNSPYDSGTFMPAEFDAAAVKLRPGEFTMLPVKTDFGMFIIKLESLTPEKQLAFDEAKDKIKEELLMAQKQEEFGKHMLKAYDSSTILNNLTKEKEQSKKELPQAEKK